MFKKEGGDEIETIIGPSVQVEGNFVANGDVVVEGIVSGSIKTEKNLRVGQGAKIFASITAANALIAGEVQGNIKVHEGLELTSTAKVFGDVKTKILTMSSGASLIGKCIAGEEKRAKLEKLDDREKQKAKTLVGNKQEITELVAGKIK
ncbi:polymer-forming cytoskeletal protein [Candidatus Falkowbacteria bacterium]|nr:polymer-forming cytoskeletal protein [Candidatus Falkowbacteria bacterium]